MPTILSLDEPTSREIAADAFAGRISWALSIKSID